MRHGLRNSLLPVVTVIGLSLGGLLGGAVLTETIFGLAGVGQTVIDAIPGRDYTVVQGFTLVIAIGYVVINLIVDVSYAYLDPRIRLSEDRTMSRRPSRNPTAADAGRPGAGARALARHGPQHPAPALRWSAWGPGFPRPVALFAVRSRRIARPGASRRQRG